MKFAVGTAIYLAVYFVAQSRLAEPPAGWNAIPSTGRILRTCPLRPYRLGPHSLCNGYKGPLSPAVWLQTFLNYIREFANSNVGPNADCFDSCFSGFLQCAQPYVCIIRPWTQNPLSFLNSFFIPLLNATCSGLFRALVWGTYKY
jgi:hypothetical protein